MIVRCGRIANSASVNSVIVPEGTVFDNRAASDIVQPATILIFSPACTVCVTILDDKTVKYCSIDAFYNVETIVFVGIRSTNVSAENCFVINPVPTE